MASFFFGVPNVLADPTFEYEYSAASGKLPQDSVPPWGVRGKVAQTVSLRDGLLVADVGAAQRSFFVIGQTDDSTAHGRTAAWKGASKASTVEFRFKGGSNDSNFEIFQVQLSDGNHHWRIRFFNNRLYPGEKNVDISELDTYRATLEDGRLTLSSARYGVIFRDRAGSDPYADSKNVKQPANCLWFGTFSPNSKAADARGEWELEFIRWTNKAAFSGPPSE